MIDIDLPLGDAVGNAALTTFLLYLIGVFVLAWLASRVQVKREFAGEYFLGSKGLGLWAFALTAGATAASGGSFMGFPAKVYSHGWVVGWWISGYVLVPLVALGLVAKRMNQVGRISGAITIPELMRRRFNSVGLGNLATLMIVFFTFFFLLAQFKAGAEIMATLFRGIGPYERMVDGIGGVVQGVPWVGQTSPDYLLCLITFAAAVIAYTTFGGFRAVVWTDVMQGIVMAGGVLVLLVLTLIQVGGVGNATEAIRKMTPPEFGVASVEAAAGTETKVDLQRGEWLADGNGEVFRLDQSVTLGAEQSVQGVEVLRITSEKDAARVRSKVNPAAKITKAETVPYAHGAKQPGAYLTAPGPSRKDAAGFMTASLALSFFLFWNFGTAGQPSQLVRQMAFRDTATLRRSILLVAVFFSAIYFPLVVIFTSARVLLPGMEIHADRIMPEMAAYVTESAGVPWLAGLLVAAPFAAVMSSVDSFLLLVTSGIVRDYYQQSIKPSATEAEIRKLSYQATILVGVFATIAALNPPRFLQDIVVFASGGLAASFLVPIAFTLYWPQATARSIGAGMIGGATMILVLYLVGYVVNGEFGEYNLLGFHPFIWSMVISTIVVLVTARPCDRPTVEVVEKYFGRQRAS